jgi:hypothetical protein
MSTWSLYSVTSTKDVLVGTKSSDLVGAFATESLMLCKRNSRSNPLLSAFALFHKRLCALAPRTKYCVAVATRIEDFCDWGTQIGQKGSQVTEQKRRRPQMVFNLMHTTWLSIYLANNLYFTAVMGWIATRNFGNDWAHRMNGIRF